jgi:hypothetical protein
MSKFLVKSGRTNTGAEVDVSLALQNWLDIPHSIQKPCSSQAALLAISMTGFFYQKNH